VLTPLKFTSGRPVKNGDCNPGFFLNHVIISDTIPPVINYKAGSQTTGGLNECHCFTIQPGQLFDAFDGQFSDRIDFILAFGNRSLAISRFF